MSAGDLPEDTPGDNPALTRTWIDAGGPVARTLAQPLRTFLHIETAGGIMLLMATVVALVWANSPFSGSYESFWHTKLTLVSFHDFALTETLEHWVNDGLMAVFFFVVGLEIKSEIVAGELRDPRRAAVPVIAALGGMIVPAGVFLALTIGSDGSGGWGIPMATDIAFALGVLALLGPRIPSSLKVFLLTLAIADDIGAILVIAIFYTSDLSLGWLLVAALLVMVVVLMRLVRVWFIPLYVVVGIAVWVATYESGIHATIAGVALGMIAPATALRPTSTEMRIGTETPTNTLRSVIFDVQETVPITVRLQNTLHPFSSFIILPVFALANAGIEISGNGISDAATSPVTLGVILGLVIGKVIGISGAAWLATRSGVGTLPDDMTWRDVVGVSALAGIGFTVAIFITGLAYEADELIEQAKLGILAASVIAAVIGVLILRRPSVGSDPPNGTDTQVDEQSVVVG